MAYRDVVLADSPFFYSRMGDASSTQQDEMAGNHDVALTGATDSVAGALVGDSNKAVSFDGINDFGSVTLDLSDTAVITHEFWLLWDVNASADDMAFEFADAGRNNGIQVHPDGPGGVFYLQMFEAGGANNAILTNRPSAAVWHHYAIVFDRTQAAATEITPYVDGVAVAYTKSQSFNDTGFFAASLILSIMSQQGTSLFGAGDLDEPAVYKSALSATRVLAHYNAGLGKHSGLPVPRRTQRRHLINR